MTFQTATKIDRELSPVLSPPIAAFLAGNSRQMTAWVEQYGTPIHLIWPSELMRNVRTLKDILTNHQSYGYGRLQFHSCRRGGSWIG